MKKINVLLLVTFAALAGVAGCEDEPEPAGVGGGAGGAGSSGTGGAGSSGARQPMPADTSPTMTAKSGTVMTDSMGRTMAPLSVTTGAMSGGSSAEVSIPMGSQFLDPAGLPVSGMATVEVTSFNTTSGEAAFMSSVGVPPEATGELTVGLATIGITIGTTVIGSVPQGIDVTLNVPATAYDSMTLLTMGQRFQFQSLDAMKKWVKVSDVTLPAASMGTFAVKGKLTDFGLTSGMGKRTPLAGADGKGVVRTEAPLCSVAPTDPNCRTGSTGNGS